MAEAEHAPQSNRPIKSQWMNTRYASARLLTQWSTKSHRGDGVPPTKVDVPCCIKIQVSPIWCGAWQNNHNDAERITAKP